VVEEKGGYSPVGWTKTNFEIEHDGRKNVVYTKPLLKGNIVIENNTGNLNGIYGAPHALFLQGEDMQTFRVDVGVNSPANIRSVTMKLELAAAKMEPGTWIYNDFNWNAVGSFVKHMPWDCKVLDLTENSYNKDARIFAFEKPDGKRTIVVSNRTGKDYTFKINTGNKGRWQCHRYTPWERGENSLGVKTEEQKGNEIVTELPHLCWEFWVEN
jgi:hypothetical protein